MLIDLSVGFCELKVAFSRFESIFQSVSSCLHEYEQHVIKEQKQRSVLTERQVEKIPNLSPPHCCNLQKKPLTKFLF